MLIKILLRYIFGYIRVTVEGYYIERFINICTTNIPNLYKKFNNLQKYIKLWGHDSQSF